MDNRYTYPPNPINLADPAGAWVIVLGLAAAGPIGIAALAAIAAMFLVAYLASGQYAKDRDWVTSQVKSAWQSGKTRATFKAVPLPGHSIRYESKKYKVYEIYWKNRSGRSFTWKYGITFPNGDSRAGVGRRACERVHKTCFHRYVATGLPGYNAARQIEYALIRAYVKRYGRCPPGQPSCK